MLGDLFEEEETWTQGTTTTTNGSGSSSSSTGPKWKSSWYYESRKEGALVGLLNQGATCYLNSLIQSLYMTPEFKSEIYAMTPEELGVPALQAQEEAKKQEEKSRSNEPDKVMDLPKMDDDLGDLPPLLDAEEESNVAIEAAKTELASMGFDASTIARAIRKFSDKPFSEAQLQSVIEWCLENPSGGEESFDDASSLLTPNMMTDVYTDSDPVDAIRQPDHMQLTSLFDTTPTPSTSPTRSAYADVDLLQGLNLPSGRKLNVSAEIPHEEPNVPTVPTDPKENEIPKPKTKIRRVLIELQRLFGKLDLTAEAAVSTEDLTKSFGWYSNQSLQQHDVHELNRILFDAISKSLEGTSKANLIRNLYKGVMVNKIICHNCKHVSERTEDFEDISLILGAKFGTNETSAHLVDALEQFVSFETLTGREQYQCDSCQQKSDADKGVIFREFPPILIFSLNRFEYDFELDKRKKLNRNFPFPLKLNVKPFTEEGQGMYTTTAPNYYYPEGTVQVETSSQVENNSQVESNPQVEASVQVENPEEKSSGDSNSEEKGNSKKSKGKSRKRKENEVEDHLWLTAQQDFSEEDDKYIYTLFAVVIHQGGAYGGHYHAYIRDPTSTEEDNDGGIRGGWFDFDDSSVRDIPVERIASQYGGSKENGYMLIYRRDTLHATKATVPSVPSYVSEAVTTANVEFQDEKEKYEAQRYKIDIFVTFPWRFQLENGVLVEKKVTTVMEDGTLREMEDLNNRKITITVDKRIPAKSLRNLVSEKLVELLKTEKDEMLSPEHRSNLNTLLLQVENPTLTLLEYGDHVYHARMSINDEISPEIPLQNTEIQHGAFLLAWNGRDLLGFPWDGQPRVLQLEIVDRLRVDPNVDLQVERPPSTFVNIGEMSPLSKLWEKISEAKNLEQNSFRLFKLKGSSFTNLKLKENGGSSLFRLGIDHQTILSVELIPAGKIQDGKSTTVEDETDAIEIFITDLTTDEQQISRSTQVTADDWTIHELKNLILGLIKRDRPDFQLEMSHVKLVRYGSSWGNLAGTSFTKEQEFLCELGFKDGVRVSLEIGKPGNPDEISLYFQVSVHGKIMDEKRRIVVGLQIRRGLVLLGLPSW
eukprot:TRINITY_DN3073_c1_g1_i2.p1 TRINITY_DN3073_c1_g1~~TRINITY_DN3073_c1_g1_i2.p1  ORF type:complete len:1102 (+),score=434.53 TRINITY_DN3073_c1_g1_i2:50-3355(+)